MDRSGNPTSPDDVVDYTSFLAFVKWLSQDRAAEVADEVAHPSHPTGPGSHGWENGSIEAFLEAAARWGFAQPRMSGTDPEPSWKEFARFLLAGKGYE